MSHGLCETVTELLLDYQALFQDAAEREVEFMTLFKCLETANIRTSYHLLVYLDRVISGTRDKNLIQFLNQHETARKQIQTFVGNADARTKARAEHLLVYKNELEKQGLEKL